MVMVALLLVVLSTAPTTAGATTPGHQQAHYCKRVDAYRIKTCAKAVVAPAQWAGSCAGAGPAGRGGRHPDRGRGPRPLLQPNSSPSGRNGGRLRQSTRRCSRTSPTSGTFTFVGFALPTQGTKALALVQSASGVRAVVAIGVSTNRRSALIDSWTLTRPHP